MGNDTIVIFGGRVEADITFNWSKTTSVITRNGSGSAFGLSDMISFALPFPKEEISINLLLKIRRVLLKKHRIH